MNPDLFSGRELHIILNDFLQPQDEDDETDIYKSLGFYLFQRDCSHPEEISMTSCGCEIRLPDQVRIENRIVQFINHSVHFSSEQLFLFSIFGAKFVRKNDEALLLFNEEHEFYYEDEIWDNYKHEMSGWKPRMVFYHENNKVMIDDTEIPLTFEETFARLSKIFEPGELERRFHYEKERTFLSESYYAIQQNIEENNSELPLPLSVIFNIIEEGDIHERRAINPRQEK